MYFLFIPSIFLKVTTTLDGTSFRAIGFAEPLAISVYKSKPDFPTRVDWDGFFHDAKHMNENEPGERPDTIYMSGLPFDWFQVQKPITPNANILTPIELSKW